MYVRPHLCRLCLGLLLLALAPFSVGATVIGSDAAFGRFMSAVVGAGQTSVSYGSTGVPLASATAATLSADGSAALLVSRSGSVANAAGNPIAVSAVGRIGGSKIAALAVAGLKVAPILGTGIALYEMAYALGYVPSKDAAGGLVVQHINPDVCYTSPCYQYRYTRGGSVGAWSGSYSTACTSLMTVDQGFAPAGYTYSNPRVSGTYHQCLYDFAYNGSPSGTVDGGYPATQSVAPSTMQLDPSSIDALQSAIASASGWPSSSAMPQAIADATALTGQSVAPDTVTVTGPATSTGTTTTTTYPDGSKATTSVTYNHTYNNTNIINTTTTTTTTTYDTSNNPTGTATKTDTPPTDKSECEKNPNVVGCQELGTAPPSDKLAHKDYTVSVTAVAFTSSSVCPSPLSFTVKAVSYGFSYQPLCDRLAALRTLILAIAGVLAAFVLVESFRVQS